MDKIYFAKVKPEAKIPTRREEDGCLDLYACFDEEYIEIQPREIKLVPTGIASVFDNKYRIAFRERGSNTKSRLIVMAGQIDSGFRGEWFVALYNTNDSPVIIGKKFNDIKTDRKWTDIGINECIQVPYDKAICQFAVELVPRIEIKEITYEDVLNSKSERMCGQLGSSNK